MSCLHFTTMKRLGQECSRGSRSTRAPRRSVGARLLVLVCPTTARKPRRPCVHSGRLGGRGATRRRLHALVRRLVGKHDHRDHRGGSGQGRPPGPDIASLSVGRYGYDEPSTPGIDEPISDSSKCSAWLRADPQEVDPLIVVLQDEFAGGATTPWRIQEGVESIAGCSMVSNTCTRATSRLERA